MIIGITGGSGSGKSSASEFFKQNGFFIIDFDEISRNITNKNSPCLNELCSAFGDEITDSEGNLIRKSLGNIVFSNKKKLGILNNITHKYILEKAFEIMHTHTNEDIIFDAPLLFETTLEKYCDKTITILCDKEIRIDRIVKRDFITYEQAAMRIASQKQDEYYLEKSDFVIYNNTGSDEFIQKLKKIIKEIKSGYSN